MADENRQNKWQDKHNNSVNAKKDNDAIAVFTFGSFAQRKSRFRDVDVAILFKEGVDYSAKQFEYITVADLLKTGLSIYPVYGTTCPVHARQSLQRRRTLILERHESAENAQSAGDRIL